MDQVNKIRIRFLRQRSDPTLETSIHALRKISENSGIVVVQKWYFVNTIFLTTVKKNCSSDRDKLLKFEAKGQEFAKVCTI